MKQQHFDRSLVFSSAQVLDDTANTASTNEIDLGNAASAEGEPIKGVINVTALSGTLTIKVCANAAAATVAATDLIVTMSVGGSGVTGQYHFTLPQSCPRYVKLFYSAGTSGTVTAWLTAAVN